LSVSWRVSTKAGFPQPWSRNSKKKKKKKRARAIKAEYWHREVAHQLVTLTRLDVLNSWNLASSHCIHGARCHVHQAILLLGLLLPAWSVWDASKTCDTRRLMSKTGSFSAEWARKAWPVWEPWRSKEEEKNHRLFPPQAFCYRFKSPDISEFRLAVL
jgi:hypothetical protein